MANDSTDNPNDRAERLEGVALSGMLGADAQSISKAWQQFAANVAAQPDLGLQSQMKFHAELAGIWFGDADMELPDDPRFEDDEWRTNPVFRRMRQSYVAWSRSLDDWLAGSDLQGLERQRAQFLLDAAKEVYAPVNSPFTPETIKKAAETGGQSLLKGIQHYFDDLQHNHGYPAVADRKAFELGKHVAATPGKVIFRNELFELIQYQPSTEKVHKRPLLYVFSQVNRFYLGDLTPERSLFKQLVDRGIQVFAISWKNPTAEHAHWTLDTYAEGVIKAIAVTRSITRQRKVDLIGLCAGGTVTAAAAGALQARGDDWINSLSLFVSILDNRPGESDFSLFVTDQSIESQKQKLRAQGTMLERDVLEMFAMLRLDENVFSFMRSNYFRGEDPIAHPLLFWSMDPTRVPAEVQCDFIELSHKNKLANNDLVVLGRRINLSRITYPVYVMAGSTDHITPWHACYRSVHLFGGEVQFVLTKQNHTQTISAHPDNPHLKYWLNDDLPEDPELWLAEARETTGNWRDHWVAWLQSHSDLKPAPAQLGNKTYAPITDAPGLYVRER